MDIVEANRDAWNEEVVRHNWWTRIVPEENIREAREGRPSVQVTPTTPVPLQWLEPLKGKEVLLACGGGGQQTPTLSAYGSIVTTIDISEGQLEQDRKALKQYGLEARLIKGSVLDLPFEDESFDHIVNPCSLNFIEDLEKVYREFHRVLKKGGTVMTGITNPVLYIFDDKKMEKKLKVKYTLPFSDLTSLSRKELEKRLKEKDTVEFSHTLDDIIGGLTRLGFAVTGFFSDASGSEPTDSFVHDSYIAIRAEKR